MKEIRTEHLHLHLPHTKSHDKEKGEQGGSSALSGLVGFEWICTECEVLWIWLAFSSRGFSVVHIRALITPLELKQLCSSLRSYTG